MWSFIYVDEQSREWVCFLAVHPAGYLYTWLDVSCNFIFRDWVEYDHLPPPVLKYIATLWLSGLWEGPNLALLFPQHWHWAAWAVQETVTYIFSISVLAQSSSSKGGLSIAVRATDHRCHLLQLPAGTQSPDSVSRYFCNMLQAKLEILIFQG